MAASAVAVSHSAVRPRPLTPRSSGAWLPPAGRLLLGVPLALKMAGANAVVLVTAIGAAMAHGSLGRGDIPLLGSALVLSFVVSTVLVVLALEPVRALERTARQILAGDLDARVQVSILADRDVRRIAGVMNNLLDALTSERERIRDLAVRVVSAHDDERAHVARELEDSTAQGLAALLYELRAELDRTEDEATRRRLERLLGMAGSSLEELRSVTSAVHPRVLTDLGLVPALEWLARGARRRHDIRVSVTAPRPAPPLRPVLAAALFSVAREAMEHAAARPGTSEVNVILAVEDAGIRLVLDNDGTPPRDEDRAAMESALRGRIGLVDGWVSVEATARGGTAITAMVPQGPS